MSDIEDVEKMRAELERLRFEFEEFVLSLAGAIEGGVRAEVALRAYVLDKAASIRE